LSSGLEKVIEYTMAVFAEVLKIAKDQFNAGATFETYGVDSLMVLELSKRFEKDLGKLPSTLLFEYSSIEALSRYLFETHRERLGHLLQLEVSPRLSTPVRDTENGRDQVATAEREEMRWSGGKIASLDTLVDSLSVRELDSLLSILGNRVQ